MTMPQIRMDWTVNISNLIAVASFLGMMTYAWFTMREDVHMLQYQYVVVDKKVEEIKEAQKSNRDELKRELLDFRNEVTSRIKH